MESKFLSSTKVASALRQLAADLEKSECIFGEINETEHSLKCRFNTPLIAFKLAIIKEPEEIEFTPPIKEDIQRSHNIRDYAQISDNYYQFEKGSNQIPFLFKKIEYSELYNKFGKDFKKRILRYKDFSMFYKSQQTISNN